MRKRSSRSRGSSVGRRRGPGEPSRRPGRTPLIVVGVLTAALAIGTLFVVLTRSGASPPDAWSRLGTEDVHSLAFIGDDPNRLLFGHHEGISESTDGGRSWQSLGTRSDAMSLGAASDGSIVIAGHEVFAASRDDGQTWADIPAALPTRDIHGFARDPSDPARMWAYLATGGLWESRDGGVSWEQVQQENILSPIAVPSSSGTRLFGLTVNGVATSDDSGRSWRPVASPDLYPIASFAATADGSVLVAGGPTGLARSDDGGASWTKLPFAGQPAAIAVTDGGRTIAIVDRSTEFYRSDDGGRSWPGP